MNNYSLKIILGICIILLFGSCTYNYIELELTPDEVSYNQHIQPIFDNNCIACHNGQIAVPDLTAEYSYEKLISGGYIDLTQTGDSKLLSKMVDNHPSPGVPSKKEQQLILQWIEQGGLNN